MAEKHGAYAISVGEFRDARKKAGFRRLLSKLSRRPDELLSFEEVAKKLNLSRQGRTYVTEIPLDAIIGSVGRYEDFNRDFLPLRDSDEGRWARVNLAFQEKGLPPIEVYKIGEVYFVVDGNHRVSIARQLNTPDIEARVIELRSPVELSPSDDIDQVILKVEMKDLNADTLLDVVRPDVDIRLTMPGRAKEIFEHIMTHRYYLGIEKQREISVAEGTASWVDHVYLPVIRGIRRLGIMNDFPGRTEADLYLWLKKHQAKLRQQWKWDVGEDAALKHLTAQNSPKFLRAAARKWQQLAGQVKQAMKKLPRFRKQ
ncbi:MAG: hypothetical protein OEY93_08670 [Anaerolineae bacterium]|nr:hypothetical protein [Anaerolineae bacterium]